MTSTIENLGLNISYSLETLCKINGNCASDLQGFLAKQVITETLIGSTPPVCYFAAFEKGAKLFWSSNGSRATRPLLYPNRCQSLPAINQERTVVKRCLVCLTVPYFSVHR